MDLIQQLKEEHKQISYSFEEIKEVFKGKNHFSDKIINLKELLINHLKLEDKLLYPKFSESKQSEIKKIGEDFQEEMTQISKKVMNFFTKYELQNILKLKEDTQFKTELEEIISAVKKRLEIEENILFPAFEKYFK